MMRSSHSPTIRSRYDYYYSSMSPASSAANFYDNQNQSLFGDPVPPSVDFLETLDNHLYGSIRRSSLRNDGNNDNFMADFMAAQTRGHHLEPSRGHPKDVPVLPPDSSFRDDYPYEPKRRSSWLVPDQYQANYDALNSDADILIPTAPQRLFPNEPINYRNLATQASDLHRISTDPNGNSDWAQLQTGWQDYPRPTSRNVMHIDHGSAIGAILPESTASSSDDNKSYPNTKQIQVLPYPKSRRAATAVSSIAHDSSSEDYYSNGNDVTPMGELSEAISTNTIITGSDYRLPSSRLHKKTSFTIINELEPNQSRPPSPSGGRTSPFRGKGFRPETSIRFMRPVSCPESPRNTVTFADVSSHDDSTIHKPTVHFNDAPLVPRRRSAIKVLETSNQDHEIYDDTSYQDPNFKVPSGSSIQAVYPELPRLKPSPAPRRHIYRSTGNISNVNDDDIVLPAPLPNPRSYHKGLLRVVSSASETVSRIPRRKSSVTIPSTGSSTKRTTVISATNNSQRRQNVSTLSPRKGNTDTGGSLIDLGMSPNTAALSRSSSRISKPTTLSPIIGTPNKEYESGNTYEDSGPRDQSSTRIPVRRPSNANIGSRTSSRDSLQFGSRETSPSKNVAKSPTKIPQKINSRTPSTNMSKAQRDAEGTTRSTNKVGASARKESSMTREQSSVKKAPSTTIKRQSSTLKRQPSSLKRETSNLQPGLKRDNSTITKKSTSIRGDQSTLHKNQSDSSLAKRLEKKNSFKLKKRTSSESDGLNEIDTANLSDKLIPLTTSSNVSMTATAIAAQPAQITAAVTDHLNKSNSSGQIVNNADNNDSININNNNNSNSNSNSNSISNSVNNSNSHSNSNINANNGNHSNNNDAIDEKHDASMLSPAHNSQKASENLLQTTDRTAMDEDMKGATNDLQTTNANNGADNTGNASSTPVMKKSDAVSETPKHSDAMQMSETEAMSSAIETNVNVIDSGINAAYTSSDNETMLQPPDYEERQSERAISVGPDVELKSSNTAYGMDTSAYNSHGAHMDPTSGTGDAKSEHADDKDDEQLTCCRLCKCCTPCYVSALCLPCRRLKSLSCCKRGQKLKTEKKVSVVKIIDETEKKADSCWKCFNCCKRSRLKKPMQEVTSIEQQAVQATQSLAAAAKDSMDHQQSTCSMCLAKFLCCRKTNKIQSTTGVENEVQKCCFCIPWRQKAKGTMAWSSGRDSIVGAMPRRTLYDRLICCRKKDPIESRRTSMNSKKQSIAPTLPPEDTRPKIDESLVDRTSFMKAALPVLPLCLAWFCLICNCLIPGFGTLCSGIFCLCLGIPRFSQYDSVKGRIGSFVINSFVGIAQAFTLIFCLVGWGWSIWWGMIMLRAAKKHDKLTRADEVDLEEAQTIASHSTSNPPVLTQNHRDAEAGRTI